MCSAARRAAVTALLLAASLHGVPAAPWELPTAAARGPVARAWALSVAPDSASAASRDVTSERGPSRRRARGRIALGAALAGGGGALAWWSARRADRAYERYLHSAGLRRQQHQLRRSERYDRVAGAGLASMELGLLLTARWIFF